MSCELGIIADLVDGSLNCRSRAGRAALAIPFTANPSMKHIILTNSVNKDILLRPCKHLKYDDFYHYSSFSSYVDTCIENNYLNILQLRRF